MWDNGSDALGLAPSHLPSDWLKLGFLLLSIIFGSILNTCALSRLIPAYQKQRRMRQKSLKAAFTLLKIHLTVSNLAVLAFYNSTHIFWLYTYQWHGGDVLCRLTHFLFVLAFQSMSNVVTAIAVDRLRNVLRITNFTARYDVTNPDAIRFVKILLFCSWGSALLFSSPQLYFWGTGEVEPGWWQCLSYWDRERLALMHKLSQTDGASQHHIDQAFHISPSEEAVYGLVHLVGVFWVPLIVSLTSYTIICALLIKLSQSNFHNAEEQTSRSVCSRTVSRKSMDTPAAEPDLEPPQTNQGDIDNFSGTAAMVASGANRTPVWRGRLRRRLLRTAAAIMLAYIISWTPYNILSLVVMADPGGSDHLSNNLDWVKALIILNALLNPVLYSK